MTKPKEFINRLKELRRDGYGLSQSIDTCLREWEGVEIVVPTEQAIEDRLLYCPSDKEIYTNRQRAMVIDNDRRTDNDFITLREAIEGKLIEL